VVAFLPDAQERWDAAVKRRWTWNIFCALSLLILATSVTLWVRSHRLGETVGYTFQTESGIQGGCFATWDSGMILVERWRQKVGPYLEGPPGWLHSYQGPFDPCRLQDVSNERIALIFGISRLGYGSFMDAHGQYARQCLVFPLWLFLIFAVPPLLWWRGRRKLGGRGFPVALPAGAEKNEMNAKAPSRQQEN